VSMIGITLKLLWVSLIDLLKSSLGRPIYYIISPPDLVTLNDCVYY